ncbi:uncharacterized protein LOC135342590 isoform X2 [Halichondria panicea]|uniref:uncharacterized protein LOC135342590 isoform X2 n=1 Tax=Halichondria panicea TaxID=6063 RepID=UPI00312B6EE6
MLTDKALEETTTDSAQINKDAVGVDDKAVVDGDSTAVVEEGSDGVEWAESQLRLVVQQQEAITAHHTALSDAFFSAMEHFQQVLVERKESYMLSIATVRDSKVGALERYREALEGVTRGKSLSEAQPSLSGGLSCGFLPEFTTLVLATASLVAEPCADVAVGGVIPVNVIGGMSPQGAFWVRVLPDQLQVKDLILQNISNAMQVHLDQSFVPLSSPSPGDLCAAKYTQDGRWYRGRVATPPRYNKVSVFFIDYGNTEEIPLLSLAPLDDGYLVFPPQMLRCSFCPEPSSPSREAKWKFSDLTHSKPLTAELLERVPAPVGEGAWAYVVRLVDKSSGQDFDVGATVTALDEATQQGVKGSFRCRDIRYKDQPLPTDARQVVSGGGGLSQPSNSSPHPSQPPTSSPIPPASPLLMSSSHPSSPASQPPTSSPQPPTSSPPPPTPSVTEETDLPVKTDVPTPQDTPTDDTPPQDTSTDGTPPMVTHTDDTTTDGTPTDDTHPQGMSTDGTPPVVTPPQDTHTDVSPPQSPPTDGTPPQTTPEDTDHSMEHKPKSLNKVEVDESVAPEESKVEVEKKKEGCKPLEPLSIMSEESDSKNQIPIMQNGEQNCLPPSVKLGSELTLFVTTDLDTDGSFWAHQEATPPYEALFEQLQDRTSEIKDQYTPVFFTEGDLCTAQFSEDDSWYRGRIEGFKGQEFSIRYLDFGNAEPRPQSLLAPLHSSCAELPPLAVKCSLASKSHTTFTQPEKDKFSELVSADDPVQAKVVEVLEEVVRVELSIVVNGVTCDVDRDVMSADLTRTIQPMEYSLKSSLPPLTLEETGAIVTSWADRMDDIASPSGDGLTLIGSGGDRFKSPSPVPYGQRSNGSPKHQGRSSNGATKTQSRNSNKSQVRSSSGTTKPQGRTSNGTTKPQGQGSNGTAKPQGLHYIEKANPVKRSDPHVNHSSSSSGRRVATPTSTRESSRSNSPQSVKSLPATISSRDGVGKNRSSPRLLDKAHLSILSHLGTKGAESREKSAPASMRISPSSGTTRSPSPRGRGARTTPPPSARDVSLRPGHHEAVDSNEIVSLFVKNIPGNMTRAAVLSKFQSHGKVHSLERAKDRTTDMFASDAERAIAALHGKTLARNANPLYIEISFKPKVKR